MLWLMSHGFLTLSPLFLDRLDFFLNSNYRAIKVHISPTISVHLPLNNLKRSCFTFEAFLLEESACYDIIRNTWYNIHYGIL